jgi:PAS domain S-box-containing protein
MKFSFLKKQFELQETATNLKEMRKRLLEILLLISFVLGTGLYISALISAISYRLYPTIIVYTLSYVWLLVITFVKGLSYRLRTNSWLFFFYLLGVINLLYSGFNVDSGLFFLTYIAMCTLLYSLKAGLRALALSLAAILVMSYAVVDRGFVLQLGLPQDDAMLWVIGGIVFLLMGILLAVSLTVLLRGLVMNLARVTRLAEELRQKNEALIGSEARYRNLVETSPDAIMLVGLDGKIIMANLASQVLLGFTSAEEMVGWELADLMPGEASGSGGGLESLLVAGVIRDAETEMLRKDGRHIMVEFSASAIMDAAGEPQAILGIGKDITKRKIAEWLLRKAKTQLEQRSEQLQASQIELRKLAAQVITVHEEERRVISQELHDDAGQALITLKHSLVSALEELPGGTETLDDRLEGALKLVDRTMALIRSVSHRLRPPALDVGGLNLSLMELCRECREQTHLQIHYQGQELPGLPDDIAISLYRVTQEAITNILKHAAATRVEIELGYKHGQISLSILDDGTMDAVDSQPHTGIGLLGMQERLSLLGGELIVNANTGRGYRLTALVPWKSARRRAVLLGSRSR